MIRLDENKEEYYDFKLSNNDGKPFKRYLDDYTVIKYHFDYDDSESVENNNQDFNLDYISLVGYDNGYITGNTSTIPTTGNTKTIEEGEPFLLHRVTGQTLTKYLESLEPEYLDQFRGIEIPYEFYFNGENTSSAYPYGDSYGFTYDIFNRTTDDNLNYVKLNGGYYQGLFKLHKYPIEFFKPRARKGWSFDALLKFPVGLEDPIIPEVTSQTYEFTFREFIPEDTGKALILAYALINEDNENVGNEVLLNFNLTSQYTNGLSGNKYLFLVDMIFFLSSTQWFVDRNATFNYDVDNKKLFITLDIIDQKTMFYFLFNETEQFLLPPYTIDETWIGLGDGGLFGDPTTFITATKEPLYLFNPINYSYGDNSGNIFYLGTRSENKYKTFTEEEINTISIEYPEFIELITGNTYDYTGFTFLNLTGLTTDKDGYYLPNGEWYHGYYNYYSGTTYSGRVYDPETSQVLTRQRGYYDIIDNALSVYIDNEGRIGYRIITGPKCDLDEDQIKNIDEDLSNFSFDNVYGPCYEDKLYGVIYTTGFTVYDVRTNQSVIDINEDKFVHIAVTFSREIPYDGCDLVVYDENTSKIGTFKIFVNGFKVFEDNHANEVIPHALDVHEKLQQGVPFNISVGGGTNGLLDSIEYGDIEIKYRSLLDRFFAGTFTGGLVKFNFYMTPLFFTEIRSIVNDYNEDYNLTTIRSGRVITYPERF